ncbi:MAG: tRNA (guanosine(37)-N1)-methyltransferase TrmD [Mariprofundales bacterium]|nr:tRNA (guanosine(37)-N1)-methyltransferase TrmD [Mariprofundales bacterium]
MLHAQILTIFPEFFTSPLSCSIPQRAIRNRLCRVDCINIRDFCTDKHHKVDDSPYGGGPGMVMKPEPVVAAIRHAQTIDPSTEVIMLTPDGEPLTQAGVRQLATYSGITLLCGRYEGIDARVDHFVDRKLSLGAFVLSGGEPAAFAILDAIIRLLPGALGNAESALQDSFHESPHIDWPHYTRPLAFEGLNVPEILASGNHAAIDLWRNQQAALRSADYQQQYQSPEKE